MSGDRAARIARLEAWAAAAGARFDALGFQLDHDGDCTARARRAIAPGEPIVVIPRALMIVDRDLGLEPLAAWLVVEARRPDSPWRPFLEALPPALPDHPASRRADELEALAGTTAHALVTEAHRELAATNATLSDDVRGQVSPAELAWGHAIIQSRGFDAPHTIDHEACFIPIVDLMNHRPGDTTWRFGGAQPAYEVTALRAFAAGDEVGFDYGAYGNAHLLAGYGFALPHNPHDEAALVLADGTIGLVTTGDDDRLEAALALAGGHDELAAAARRGLDRLGEDRDTGTSSWLRACALVRRGEREVLERVLALCDTAAARS